MDGAGVQLVEVASAQAEGTAAAVPTAAAGRGWLHRPKIEFGVIALVLVWKAMALGIAVVGRVLFQPQYFFPGRYDLSLSWGQLSGAARAAFTTWDSHHYLYLADYGYPTRHPWDAFYPFLPLSTRLLTYLTGDSLVSALLISNLASLVALYLLFLLVQRSYSRRVALLTLALLLAFPTAFYLNLVYSESSFLFFAVLFFYCSPQASRSTATTSPSQVPRPGGWRLWLAEGAAFALPWTRSVGIFILAPQAVSLFESGWADAPAALSRPRRALRAVARRQTLLLLGPLAGLGLYFVFMSIAAGDPFIAFRAQQDYIGQKSLSNLWYPLAFLRLLFTSHLLVHDYVNSALDRAFFLWFVASLPLVYRRVNRPMFVFCLTLGLVPLLGTFMSYMRYVMVAFPLFIAYGAWLEDKSPVLLIGILIAMALLQSLFLNLQALDHWVA